MLFCAEDVADSTTGSVALDNPRMFKIGDLVWGPIRGFPSWPGKLVAESEVRGNHKLESGKVSVIQWLVCFNFFCIQHICTKFAQCNGVDV